MKTLKNFNLFFSFSILITLFLCLNVNSFAEIKQIDIWDFGAKLEKDNIYLNHITPSNIDSLDNLGDNGKTTNPEGLLTLDNGNIEIKLKKQERFYYFSDDQKNRGKKSAGNPKKNYTFKKDPYNYKGQGYLYFNGSSNENTRTITIQNINKGDRITMYGFEDNVTSSIVHFDFQGEIQKGETFQKSSAELGTPFIYEVVAQNTGTYKIWFNSNGGKMRIHRIVRAPAVNLNGKINLGNFKISNYKLNFVNEQTKEITEGNINANGTYSVKLAPGYNYIAILANATGYGFTNNSKLINLDINSFGKSIVANLNVEEKTLYTLTGKIKGFKKSYNLDNFAIKMNPPKDNSIVQPAFLTINKDKMTYTVVLEPNVAYTAELIGVNDYSIISTKTFKNNKNNKQVIKVDQKALYTIKGKFINLQKEVTKFKIDGISFKNLKDEYVYKANFDSDSYKIKLRNGDYQVILQSDKYKTLGHISVNNQINTKDIMINSINPIVKNYPWTKDIYVGYSLKDNNFNTISEALKAISGMDIQDESQRVTVHIAPGTYRQQLIINTPYITFVNNEAEKGDVIITWYYGIGYKYYSARSFDNSTGPKGYYDPELDYDKFEKSPVNYWGSTVYLTKEAKGFIAENIVFENSFNRYMTKEELEDGVEVAGTSPIKLERNINSEVNAKAYKERAAAIYIVADNVEFYKSSFLSNQDTLGTGSKGTHRYFKNCFIEGGTDYIFGGGNIVFDNCQLNWFGAKDVEITGQVLTAAKGDSKGYLFRNSTITSSAKSNKANLSSTGLLGRPWEQSAKVAFLNTKFSRNDIIEDKGWTSMSSAIPSKANFYEFNSTYNGTIIDTNTRTKTKISAFAKEKDYNVKEYFGNWTPVNFVEDSIENPEFSKDPYITSTNNILTINYEFKNDKDNKNDSSLIQWYKVDKNGVATFIDCNTAYISKSYTLTSEDNNYSIKAVITPEVVSGKKGKAKVALFDKTNEKD